MDFSNIVAKYKLVLRYDVARKPMCFSHVMNCLYLVDNIRRSGIKIIQSYTQYLQKLNRYLDL